MNTELKTIFGDSITIGSGSTAKTIPTAHLRYKGDKKTFVTWTIINGYPALSGDDECLFSIVEVDVDIFSDGNYLDVVSKVKQLMKTNGWIWTDDSPELYEEDTGLYHLTCTFEKERSI